MSEKLDLDMATLEKVRSWALGRKNQREGALFVFAWACGVCSKAGIPMRQLSEMLTEESVDHNQHAAGCQRSRGCVPGCQNYDPFFD